MSTQKITIADVARRANVSPSTVSNYLNGRVERMRADTRERIKRAIEELGYRPNPVARQLKTGHAPFIGLIVPSVANPFYGIFARHVEAMALENGYQVLLGNSDRDPQRERRYAEELWNYGVRGIVFGSSLTHLTHLEDLIKQGLRVVAFDRSMRSEDKVLMDSVGVDNAHAMRMATRHLLGLGHRRIAFVSGPIRTVSRLDRLAGYREALRDAGIDPDPDLVWQGEPFAGFGDFDAVQLGRQAAHELLTLSNPPTAIVAVNDMYAFGVYAGARDLGLRIPDDLSVVGFDDIDLTEVVEPPLTTIRQPIAEIAAKAVSLITQRLEGDDDTPYQYHVLPAQLVVRRSTAQPRLFV
ncbi:MAG: LacI family transcriptional regulator [Ardenticatenia bacterium]|nr:MAG: LacI family transcriptional regulator [Ardenticatenia bacterium]